MTKSPVLKAALGEGGVCAAGPRGIRIPCLRGHSPRAVSPTLAALRTPTFFPKARVPSLWEP